MTLHVAFVSLAVGLVVVIGYVLVMRVFFKESKELDKRIDFTKMKKWRDEED